MTSTPKTQKKRPKTSSQAIPFPFVLDELERCSPLTRKMFGCLAIYLEDKMVLILRDKEDYLQDNGVWLATSHEHHEGLKKDFPSMRSVSLLGAAPTAWQNIPTDSADFEEAVMRACQFIKMNDPRIGKIPQKKKKKTKR
jgi:hypothetical protein